MGSKMTAQDAKEIRDAVISAARKSENVTTALEFSYKMIETAAKNGYGCVVVYKDGNFSLTSPETEAFKNALAEDGYTIFHEMFGGTFNISW